MPATRSTTSAPRSPRPPAEPTKLSVSHRPRQARPAGGDAISTLGDGDCTATRRHATMLAILPAEVPASMTTRLAICLLLAFVPTVAADVDFARDVQQLLASRCVRCHGPKKQEGGLRLDLRRRAIQGGDTGPALGTRGELLRRIESTEDNLRMPPGGKPLDKG